MIIIYFSSSRHLIVQHIACFHTNTFLIFKKKCKSQNYKVTPVGEVKNIDNVAKMQRQSLMR